MFHDEFWPVYKSRFYVNFKVLSKNENPVILTIHFVRVKDAVIWRLLNKFLEFI